MFNLYGDFSKFNYGKQDDVECSGSPSNIDVWSGRLAGYRGRYCPGVGDNQLLIWFSASPILKSHVAGSCELGRRKFPPAHLAFRAVPEFRRSEVYEMKRVLYRFAMSE